jgi:hypothetical protein
MHFLEARCPNALIQVAYSLAFATGTNMLRIERAANFLRGARRYGVAAKHFLSLSAGLRPLVEERPVHAGP